MEVEDLLEDCIWYWYGISALDQIFRRQNDNIVGFIAIQTTLPELAHRVENLNFPGIEGIDAATWLDGKRLYFRCLENNLPREAGFNGFSGIPPLDIVYNPKTRRCTEYSDYRLARSKNWQPVIDSRGFYDLRDGTAITDLACFASRFLSVIEPERVIQRDADFWPPLAKESVRTILNLILTGSYAARGLKILERSGFVAAFLPELIPMNETMHSKEGHPEGNVWEHSLETLEHRKYPELALSFALLLHDSGKPHAPKTRQHRFAGHAELGAKLGRALLKRLGYDEVLIGKVCWLVEAHMIPGALDGLPLSRSESFMSNPLFPELLELYRCDLVSTWRGPDGYYEACQKFRNWLKNSRNPWLKLDRKALIRKFVSA